MNCNSHEEIKQEILEIRKSLTVTVINGKRIEKPLNEAVAEIWEHTSILRDASKFHMIMKKYNIYRITAILILISVFFHLGMSIKDIILKFIG